MVCFMRSVANLTPLLRSLSRQPHTTKDQWAALLLTNVANIVLNSKTFQT